MNATATDTADSSAVIDPLELQAKFESMLAAENGPKYVPTVADMTASLFGEAPAEVVKTPLSKVEILELEEELRIMLQEHKAAGGSFCTDDHGVIRVMQESGESEIYMRRRGKPQDLLGIMALGYEPLIDVHSTVRSAFDILAEEVDALEVGWSAHVCSSVLGTARFMNSQDSSSLADMAYSLACEFMGAPPQRKPTL